jgi:DNA-binding winged helix-turn-helix (wHTH) protein/tetratricopeptide (TPR) repeat protein
MSAEQNTSYEFGAFRLIPAERQLLRDDQSITLPPKAFQALSILVQNHGHAVTKKQLIETLWPDSFVEESNLNHYISQVRKALTDGVDGQRYIETVPKLGYRFTGHVRESHGQTESLLIHRQTRTRVVVKEEQFERSATKTALVDSDQRSSSQRRRRIAEACVALIVILATILIARGFYLRRAASTERAALMAREHTLNHAAYEEYLAGRSQWNKRNAAGLFQSIQHFQKAIEDDPNFSLGYAGLADAYAFDLVHWHEAEQLANKALQIEPGLAEPHATIGFIRSLWEWRRKDAEAEFKEAISLNPNYATAHQWYAVHLATTRRLPEAETEMKRALELEPNSPAINADMGQILYFDRRYDEAFEACRKALALDPDFFNAHAYLIHIYEAKGLYDDAIREFLVANSLPGVAKFPFTEAGVTKAYRSQGIKGYWKEAAAELENRSDSAYEVGQYYAQLGDREKTLHWLEQAVAERGLAVNCAYVDPAFDNVRNDPKYWQLIEKLGLHWPI